MKTRISQMLFLLTLCSLTGCLEFERQTMSYRHDPATDTLFLFQNYEGVFGANDPAKLSEEETKQLNSVLKTQRTFFFNNWILEYNRATLEEIRQTPSGEVNADAAFETAIRQIADLALANITVENVGFYLNSRKQLCAAQKVTIHNISKVLPALNKVLRHLAREEAAKSEKTTEESKGLNAFADGSQDAISLKGNRLTLRWPVTADEYRKFKEESREAKALAAAGQGVAYTDGLVVLTIGKVEASSGALTLPFSENPYADNLVAEARARGLLLQSFDPEEAARAFLMAKGSANANPK